jgi:hypothetical protein
MQNNQLRSIPLVGITASFSEQRGVAILSAGSIALALATLIIFLLNLSAQAQTALNIEKREMPFPLAPTVITPSNVSFVGGWSSEELDASRGISLGDMDGDGDLDMAVANFGQLPNRIYENNGAGSYSVVWQTPTNEIRPSWSVAWGDLEGDGDLDLAFGTNSYDQVYRNEGGGNFTRVVSFMGDIQATRDIAWGDMDGDGDLDLVLGSNGYIRIFPNTGEGGFTTAISLLTGTNTQSISLGDMDRDDDLDILLGNLNQLNQIYRNGGGMSFTLQTIGGDPKPTSSVAWGDMDGDGDLDFAVGNDGDVSQLYENDGSGNFVLAWEAMDSKGTQSVAWGDVDGDGDLDLALGNSGWPNTIEVNQVYQNEDGAFNLVWESTGDTKITFAVAWGDVDNDGDLDLVFANDWQINQIYLNESVGHSQLLWESTELSQTYSVAFGDIDSDGDLDLAVGNVGGIQIYRNNEELFVLAWDLGVGNDTRSVAWGDMDGDRDLDLAVGNWGQGVQIYQNNGIGGFSLFWVASDPTFTRSVAWGDVDGDGDLDLAVGNMGAKDLGCNCYPGQVNQIYKNLGGTGFDPMPLELPGINATTSVAWGDMDGDGDLDLAVGNHQQLNQILRNDGAIFTSSELTGTVKNTSSVAWGDMDGDGDLDLAVGNWDHVNQIYQNENGEDFNLIWESTGDVKRTEGIAWGDMDGDGDLDLVVANGVGTGQPEQIYRNEGEGDFVLAWESSLSGERATFGVTLGDVEGDGDLDMAFGNGGYSQFGPESNQIFENEQHGGINLPNNPPFIRVVRPDGAAAANFYASSVILSEPAIPITYTLFDPERDPVGRISVFYSADGGANWLPAIATGNTLTTNLATGLFPTATLTNTHVFTWDTFASGFFGQSDNVVLRFIVYPQPAQSDSMGSYHYPNNVPGPYLWPYASATTGSFRVRGTQIRVLSDTVPMPGALAYRIPAGQMAGGELLTNQAGQPFLTDRQGYLQGRGQLNQGDQLIALLPISSTEEYVVYYTSAEPNEAGLEVYEVTGSGVQTLTVSAENPLILFNLDVSLEWDARNDPTFLNQLENDLKRSSQILYDLTNGQVALGQVRIYHNRENWNNADVVIQAGNSIRPAAILGGVVTTPTNDVGVSGVITNAFVPGQVRMGATWTRFGDPGGTLGEDWPRALAHELGHYLLFMPDNYLGLSPGGLLTLVDCEGSAMTDPYAASYSEFLPPSEWTGDCLSTLAEHFLGRSDWETITRFYPMLDGSGGNSGPSNLPLAVTQVEFIEPVTSSNTLAAPVFNLVDSSGNPAPIANGQGQAYLFKTNGNSDSADDYVTRLGSPIGDLVLARGAEPGDRLCVYDFSQDPLRLGCLESVSDTAEAVTLNELPGWMPAITVSKINTDTFVVTATHINENSLSIQLLPYIGPPSSEMAMTLSGNIFTRTVELADRAYAGFVRVWVPGSNPRREILVEFAFVEEWNGKAFDWGGKAFAWGGKAFDWGAPVMSSDGQVSLFNLEDTFGGTLSYTLETLTLLPELPIWLTPVGQAYRVKAEGPFPESSLLFQYLGRDVPDGHEAGLHIYYSPDEGQSWQRLPTELDYYHNHAAAAVEGEGIYVLIATVEMAPFSPGWNLFGYPIQGTRPVTQALASIAGSYTSIYTYDPNSAPVWLLYDQTVADNHLEFTTLVNNLAELEFGRGYWIYATDYVTLYLGIEGSIADSPFRQPESFPFPPASFYGWITATAGFTPTAGMSVTAEIAGADCGQTTIQPATGGRLFYSLQVSAEPIGGPPNGCGWSGRTITFHIEDWVMAHDRLWDNSQAWFLPLDTPADVTPPVLTVPATKTVEATGPTGTVVTFTVTVTDTVDPNPTVVCTPTSGSLFPLGTTLVNCIAEDYSGNSTSLDFPVIVVDTTAPALIVPVDMTLEATGPTGVVVSYTVIVSDIVDTSPTLDCVPAAGTVFPLGKTTVNCIAEDASGNGVSDSFYVVVVDTTAPTIIVPADIITDATVPTGAVVTYTVIVTDLVDTNPTVACHPPSGSLFIVGSTLVTCLATDASANNAEGTFSVTVTQPQFRIFLPMVVHTLPPTQPDEKHHLLTIPFFALPKSNVKIQKQRSLAVKSGMAE